MKWYLVYIAIILSLVGQSQIAFQKTYGSYGYERASRILQVEDTGYVVLGSSGLTGGSSDIYLLKIDSLGNYLWSRYHGGPNQEHGTDFEQTHDSGFVVTGYTNSYGMGGYDVLLMKLDKFGNLEWETSYGGTDWDFGYGIEILPDSGFVIVGETYSFGEGQNDVYVIRTDKNGNLLWQKTYGTPAEDIGTDLLITTNNEIILTGHTNSIPYHGFDILTYRLNLNGDTIWHKTYGDTLDDFANRIKPVAWYYNILGTTFNNSFGGSDIYLIGIDDLGDTSYTKVQGTAQDEEGIDYAVRPPVDLFLSGTIITPVDGYRNYVSYYTTYYGEFITSWSFGDIGEDVLTGARFTNDQGFILCGHTSASSIGAQDIYVVKIGPHPTFPISNQIDDQFQDFTSLERTEDVSDIRFYPNPVLTTFKTNVLENGVYEIVDLQGNTVLRDRYSKHQELDVSPLPSGTYLFRITSKTNIYLGRIIKI